MTPRLCRYRHFDKYWLLRPVICILYGVSMAKRRTTKLSDQIRRAIDDSGLTRYRIAQDTGIDESALAKFYNGTRGLSLVSLDRLGEYLGLSIVMDRKPPAKGK